MRYLQVHIVGPDFVTMTCQLEVVNWNEYVYVMHYKSMNVSWGELDYLAIRYTYQESLNKFAIANFLEWSSSWFYIKL